MGKGDGRRRQALLDRFDDALEVLATMAVNEAQWKKVRELAEDRRAVGELFKLLGEDDAGRRTVRPLTEDLWTRAVALCSELGVPVPRAVVEALAEETASARGNSRR